MALILVVKPLGAINSRQDLSVGNTAIACSATADQCTFSISVVACLHIFAVLQAGGLVSLECLDAGQLDPVSSQGRVIQRLRRLLTLAQSSGTPSAPFCTCLLFAQVSNPPLTRQGHHHKEHPERSQRPYPRNRCL